MASSQAMPRNPRKETNYGAFEGPKQVPSFGHLTLDLPLKSWHKRINIPALVEALVIPWALYFFVLSVVSSEFHYQHQAATDAIAVASVIVPVLFAVKGIRQHCSEDGATEPTWYPYLAVACSLAWLAALGLGYYNYNTNIAPYFDLMEMGNATNVDPSVAPGEAFLDVSRITFAPGSYANQMMSLGFKDGDVYCVAPIVNGNNALPPATYNFWAVGINCCLPNPPPQHFYCGDGIGVASATSGILWTQEATRPFFRLAIQMAEIQYNITAGTLPLYFTWTQDAEGGVENLQQNAHSNFRLYVIASIVLFGLAGAVVAIRARYTFEEAQHLAG